MSDTPIWEPVRTVFSEIRDRLVWAEVHDERLELLDPETPLDDGRVRDFIARQRASTWLPSLPSDELDAQAVTARWAPTVYEAAWSGPRGDQAGDALNPWLRGALAAYLTHRKWPQLFLPPPRKTSWRSLDGFAYQQVGALVARLYGEATVIRLLAGGMSPHEAFGSEVAEALDDALADESPAPGRGSDTPGSFGNALVDAFVASGRQLPPARSFERQMAWEAIAFSCVQRDGDGIANTLPFASCNFDFVRRCVDSHAFEPNTEKSWILPPQMCQLMVDAGQNNYNASLSTASRRAVDVLLRHIFSP